MAYIIGTISEDDVVAFEKECDKLGWIIISRSSGELVYLDKRCNRLVLDLGIGTAYQVVGS